MRPTLAFLAILISLPLAATAAPAAAAPPSTSSQRKTQDIQVQVRTERWSGWGPGALEPDGATTRPLPPEKFERFETPAGQSPTFSGKVIGIPAGKTAQVTVVTNHGTQWIDPKNYKSVKTAPDGSFTVTAPLDPAKADATKSLCVNLDGRVSQFLRAEFTPTESARNIEFQLAPVKTVVLSMEDSTGKSVRSFRVEAFNAYIMKDDAGQALNIQRLTSGSTGGGAIVFDAPPEPIAVLLSSNGLAPYYQIIDPRQADEFHFKMIPAARIRGTVTRDGQPVPGQQIYMVNRAAPLSATIRKTDPQGRFDFPGRVPGQQDIRVGAYQTTLELTPGETADVTLETGAAATTPATVQ
jgi:hypothetical protein